MYPRENENNIVPRKRSTPPPDDPLRIFYTSLLRQNPESKMALKWCYDRGLLPLEADGLARDFDRKLRLSSDARRRRPP